MRCLCISALLLAFASPAAPQATISTFAGGGPDQVPGTAANINSPRGMISDAAGNLYIAAENQHRVFKLDSMGQLTVFAGSGTSGFSGDGGPAIWASLNSPSAVALDTAGNLFICESSNNRIRRVDAGTGTITTVAGTGTFVVAGDGGPATAASFGQAFGLAVDSNNNLYVADLGGRVVRKIVAGTDGLITGAADEIITTVAGNGGFGFSGDGGPAILATLAQPISITADTAGNFFIADQTLNRIRRVDVGTGIITTVAGNGTGNFFGDGGLAKNAGLNGPRGVAVDAAGNIYIADTQNQRIRKVNTLGIISTIAGNGILGFSGDGGSATAARLAQPNGVAVNGSGDFWIADVSNFRVRRVTSGTISTAVGNGTATFSGEGFAAADGGLNTPVGPAVDGRGNLYIADFGNRRIRRVDVVTGIMTTYAGNGVSGFSGDGGPATGASFNAPLGLAFDGAGNLYLGDNNNQRIRRIDGLTGIITTFAGSGLSGFGGDGGPATDPAVRMSFPQKVVVDGGGNLYFSDNGNNRIRKVTGGVIRTFAGTGFTAYNGDNIPAVSANLNSPVGIAVDNLGNLYIAEINGGRVRKVDTTGKITTAAGTGVSGFSGDGGPATAAQVNAWDVSVDAAGNLFIAESVNQRVRQVDAITGVITTVAGTGVLGFLGDGGPATAARLANPRGIVVDSTGSLIVADTFNHRMRRIVLDTTPPVITPTITGTLGNAGWYVSNVKVSWTANDPESVISSTSGCGTSNVTTDTTGTTFTCTATSAGGTSSQSVTIKRDATPPTITFTSQTPTANRAGWNSTNVSLTWSCSDPISGPVSSTVIQSLTTEGANQSATGTCTDAAGNTASDTQPGINIDKTPPSAQLSASPATPNGSNGWYTTSVTIHTSGSASLSAPVTCTADQFQSANTAGRIFNGSCTNAAGLTTNAAALTIKLDTAPPTISFAGQNPAANAADWNNTNVTLTWNCADSISGPVSPSVTQSLTTEGSNQSATGTCTDAAGNTASNTQTGINIDKTPPTLTFAAATPGANAYGWNNSNVSFAFTASDSLSDIASTSVPSPVVLSTEGAAVSGSVTVTDKAGNTATFTTPAAKIDKTPPTASVSASPGANANGWNNTNVTASFSGGDSLSGIDSCTAPVTVSTEGANQSASGTCTDKAGNTSSAAALSNINIDKTPPTAAAAASPGPNANGWNNTNVTVSFSGTDSLSGIDHCDAPVALATEGTNESASGTCTDKAGNASTTATANGINIDKTPPTLMFGAQNPAPNGAGWNNSNVSFAYTASDSLSGIASPSVPSPVVLSAEGTSVTATVTVTDKAGNTVTFTTPAAKIDKTPPASSLSRTPNPNGNGWNNSSVTVSFTCSDSLSGLAAGSPPAPTTVSGEGANQSVTGGCSDVAGNSASSTMSGISIDLTPPTITFAGRTAPNANGWNNTNVTLTWNCSDSLSSPAANTVSQVLGTEGANQSSIGTCADRAGNSASNTQTSINIDKTPPVLHPSVSPNPIVLNGTGTATPGATDSLSGIATQSCVALSTNSVGAKTVSCTATDKAGNPATQTANYNVNYAPAGGMCGGDVGHTILQPINADGTSVWKQGRTIPVKFKVCDANGIPIGTPGVVTSFMLTGRYNGTVAPVDETVTATNNDTAFRWDGQEWIFNLSTSGLAANNTYIYTITLNDGTIVTGTTFAGAGNASFQYGLR